MLRNSIPADQYCESVRDGTHDSPKPVLDSGKPLVTSKNLKEGQLNLADTYLISNEDFEKINKRSKVDQWDVLISMIGTLGELYLVSEQPDYAIKNLGLFKTKSEYDGKWLYYCLKSPTSRRYIETNAQGSTQQYLSLKTLREFPIPLPNNESEKIAICNILSAIDSKIAINQKMNQTLEDIAKAIFKSWFIDFDPTRAKVEGKPTGLPDEISDLFPNQLEESELGDIPKGWYCTELKKFIGEVGEKVQPSNETTNKPYVPIECIASRSLVLREKKEGSEANSSLVAFNKRDILFGAMRPYFHKVCISPFSGTTRTTCLVLNSINPEYFGFSLFTLFDDSTIKFATTNSTGTTIPYIKWKNGLDSLKVALPSSKLASIFNILIEPILEKLLLANKEFFILSELRETLIPKLISGELEISGIQKLLEEAGI